MQDLENHKERVVLVDDDRNITLSVSMILEEEGYDVTICNDGEQGCGRILSDEPDIVILDIKMPRMDGLEVLSKIREKYRNLPVIMLTSKDDELDEILGLRLGADDYITKPFSQRLLIERIKVLLRRKKMFEKQSFIEEADKDSHGDDQIIYVGNLRLERNGHKCFWKETEITLTVTEFLILRELVRESGKIKTREEISIAAYGEVIDSNSRAIDTNIKRIRKKFTECDENFDCIETLYGSGYRYRKN